MDEVESEEASVQTECARPSVETVNWLPSSPANVNAAKVNVNGSASPATSADDDSLVAVLATFETDESEGSSMLPEADFSSPVAALHASLQSPEADSSSPTTLDSSLSLLEVDLLTGEVQAHEEEQDDVWVFQRSEFVDSVPLSLSSQTDSNVLRPAVPPPPAPFFPVSMTHRSTSIEFPVDPTPCLVELAACKPEAMSDKLCDVYTPSERHREDVAPASGTECELLLPDAIGVGSCRSSCASSPGVGGARCSLEFSTPIHGNVQSLPRTDPRREYQPRSPIAVALLMSPSLSCMPSPCPQPSARPAAPRLQRKNVSPASRSPSVKQHEHPMVSDENFLSTSPALEGCTSSPSEDDTTWLRAARRTLLPLGVPPVGQCISWDSLLDGAPLSTFSCCYAPKCSRPAVVQTSRCASVAADGMSNADAVATESRLLQVPRPSLQGLRTTSTRPVLLQDRTSSRMPMQSVTGAEEVVTVGAAELGEGCQVLQHPCYRGNAMPALPRQAPALPSRAPSGDNAVDAAELLLARVVDPFGTNEAR